MAAARRFLPSSSANAMAKSGATTDGASFAAPVAPAATPPPARDEPFAPSRSRSKSTTVEVVVPPDDGSKSRNTVGRSSSPLLLQDSVRSTDSNRLRTGSCEATQGYTWHRTHGWARASGGQPMVRTATYHQVGSCQVMVRPSVGAHSWRVRRHPPHRLRPGCRAVVLSSYFRAGPSVLCGRCGSELPVLRRAWHAVGVHSR